MKIHHYVIKNNNFIYDYTNKLSFNKDLKTTFKNCNIKTYEYDNYVTYLIEVTLINKQGKEFEKGFDDIKKCNNFLNRVKRGNSLKVSMIATLSDNILKEIKL